MRVDVWMSQVRKIMEDGEIRQMARREVGREESKKSEKMARRASRVEVGGGEGWRAVSGYC